MEIYSVSFSTLDALYFLSISSLFLTLHSLYLTSVIEGYGMVSLIRLVSFTSTTIISITRREDFLLFIHIHIKYILLLMES